MLVTLLIVKKDFLYYKITFIPRLYLILNSTQPLDRIRQCDRFLVLDLHNDIVYSIMVLYIT